MDKLTQYRQIIQEILLVHSKHKTAYGDIEMEVLFDQERNHYQVLRAGWLQKSRVYGVLIHIDLIDNKAWVQYDGTEVGVANELLEQGIPRKDIVLAYHSPFMRQYNGFAVG
jgi:XisI protein